MSTVVDCLKGSNSQSSRQKNLSQVSTFGLMKDLTQKEIRSLIGNLLADGYIRVVGSDYPILALTEKSKDILFSREKFYIRKIEENKERKKKVVDITDYDHDLFEILRKLRLDLSKERNIPPFIIFSDQSLRDMADKKPISEEEFLRIKGVGEKKLLQYGDLFIEEIRKYNN